MSPHLCSYLTSASNRNNAKNFFGANFISLLLKVAKSEKNKISGNEQHYKKEFLETFNSTAHFSQIITILIIFTCDLMLCCLNLILLYRTAMMLELHYK